MIYYFRIIIYNTFITAYHIFYFLIILSISNQKFIIEIIIMRLKLLKINCRSEDISRVHMSIKARYNFEGEEFSDTIQLNYNGRSRDIYLTVKAVDPGIGLVIERVIDVVKDISTEGGEPAAHLKLVIDLLFEKLGMEYDTNAVAVVLDEYKTFMDHNPKV